MSSDDFPSPPLHFLTQLAELRSADIVDMDEVGRLLVELAADEEYLGPLIEAIPPQRAGGKWLLKPERGPRLVLFHRPAGVMAYTHSHHCWVAVAPVRGVETHQRWDAVRHEDGRAELRLADDRTMQRGDVATLVPPGDVHNHGHVLGTGPSPYSLILLGDDMYRYERKEYDPRQGTWRKLEPGDPGRSHRLRLSRSAMMLGWLTNPAAISAAGATVLRRGSPETGRYRW
jgi:predicted metal-dependent enzyme (double-stranded beta helix superfamily)